MNCPVAPDGKTLPWHFHDEWYAAALSEAREERDYWKSRAEGQESRIVESVRVLTKGWTGVEHLAALSSSNIAPDDQCEFYPCWHHHHRQGAHDERKD